jgi:hypothetical protein
MQLEVLSQTRVASSDFDRIIRIREALHDADRLNTRVINPLAEADGFESQTVDSQNRLGDGLNRRPHSISPQANDCHTLVCASA